MIRLVLALWRRLHRRCERCGSDLEPRFSDTAFTSLDCTRPNCAWWRWP